MEDESGAGMSRYRRSSSAAGRDEPRDGSEEMPEDCGPSGFLSVRDGYRSLGRRFRSVIERRSG
jgi:hypothetical protein